MNDVFTIPNEIDSRIPDVFYDEMIVKLKVIFRLTYEEDLANVLQYGLNPSTVGWVEAFKQTCSVLGLDWLAVYWDSLEWYDSDAFDEIIEQRLISRSKQAFH